MTSSSHAPAADAGTALLFDVLDVDRLTPDHLLRLGAGVQAAVRIHSFLSAAECVSIMDGLQTCPMGWYDEQLVRPRIGKLGPAAFDHYRDGEFTADYWAHAAQSARSRSTLLAGRDPLAVATDRLQAGWAGTVRPLTAAGRPLFAGMIREMNDGAGLHFDELVREFPDGADEVPAFQLAFNCYLSMPEAGGELHVFRRRWTPTDEQDRDGSYWYPDQICTGEPMVDLQADVGDAILFDSRNYHRIRPRRGTGRRVTLSFFVGLSGSGDLLLWS